jgi:hypothetical protein
MTVTQRRRAALDDDSSDLYDPRYPGKKVIADQGRVSVPLYLTDSHPNWTPPTRSAALFDYARDAYRNYYYQPHFFVGDSADPLAAERAYLDAYLDDDETMTPRDRYIKRLQNAYRTPPGRDPDDDADAVERQRKTWTGESPVAAKPGFGDARPRQTNDAAVADRDQAHRDYLDRITNAWRLP